MNDTIPTFKAGDRVRVMDTPVMLADGLAGLRGTVEHVSGDGVWVHVRIGASVARSAIRAIHLMKESP